MSLGNISLRQLHIFQKTVENQSVTKAAEALGLTSPAVSIALRAIDDQLGAETIKRNKGENNQLTAIGAELYAYANEVEGLTIRYGEHIESLRLGRSGQLSLGFVSTAKYFAPKLVRSFLDKHSNFNVDLKMGNRGETIDFLKNRTVDLAIFGRPPRAPKVKSVQIAPHPHVIIVAPDFAKRHQDITETVFLVRELGSGTRNLFENFIQGYPELAQMRRQEFSSNESIKQAVMGGLGAAFISASTIEHEVRSKRLKIYEMEGLPIYRDWYVVWREDEELSIPAQVLLEHIEANRELFLSDWV